ncbi:hypothetical protein D3C80_1816870 [compost metagenome]
MIQRHRLGQRLVVVQGGGQDVRLRDRLSNLDALGQLQTQNEIHRLFCRCGGAEDLARIFL